MEYNDWNTCFEMGLNHLGDEVELNLLFDKILKLKKKSISIQIRENSFYINLNKKLKLNKKAYDQFILKCKENKIIFGFAIGPLDSLEFFDELIIKPNFIKLLSLSSENIKFVEKVHKYFQCPIYYSIGLSSFEKIENIYRSYFKKDDFFIYTSFSHDSNDQGLNFIFKLKELTHNVAFGLHSVNTSIAYAALGCGAKKVFVYFGNKNKRIPDLKHSIDLNHIEYFSNNVNECINALNERSEKIEAKISFLK